MNNIQLKDNEYIKFSYNNEDCVALDVDSINDFDNITNVQLITINPNHHFIVTLTDNEFNETIATAAFNCIDDAEAYAYFESGFNGHIVITNVVEFN